MYVCICNAVTDKAIRAAVAEGARSIRDLNRELDVGGQCGKCTCVARAILRAEQEQLSDQLAYAI